MSVLPLSIPIDQQPADFLERLRIGRRFVCPACTCRVRDMIGTDSIVRKGLLVGWEWVCHKCWAEFEGFVEGYRTRRRPKPAMLPHSQICDPVDLSTGKEVECCTDLRLLAAFRIEPRLKDGAFSGYSAWYRCPRGRITYIAAWSYVCAQPLDSELWKHYGHEKPRGLILR